MIRAPKKSSKLDNEIYFVRMRWTGGRTNHSTYAKAIRYTAVGNGEGGGGEICRKWYRDIIYINLRYEKREGGQSVKFNGRFLLVIRLMRRRVLLRDVRATIVGRVSLVVSEPRPGLIRAWSRAVCGALIETCGIMPLPDNWKRRGKE